MAVGEVGEVGEDVVGAEDKKEGAKRGRGQMHDWIKTRGTSCIQFLRCYMCKIPHDVTHELIMK